MTTYFISEFEKDVNDYSKGFCKEILLDIIWMIGKCVCYSISFKEILVVKTLLIIYLKS